MEMTIIEKLRDAYQLGTAKPVIPENVQKKLQEAALRGVPFVDMNGIPDNLIRSLKSCGFQVSPWSESGEFGSIIRGWERPPKNSTGLLRQCVTLYETAWDVAREASDSHFEETIRDCEQAAKKGCKSYSVKLETHQDNWGKHHLLPSSQLLVEKLEKTEGLKVEKRAGSVLISGWAD